METEIIHWIKKRFLRGCVPLGAGFDDAALVKVPRKEILVSCDMIIEGTHFFSDEKPENIGRKSACISLSDMAAMGAKPLYMLLSLGIPRHYSFEAAKRIFRGIESALRPFDVALVGGDTVRSPKIVLDSVILGVNETGKVLCRGGAQQGDVILATGYFGRSLETGWHCRFMPRVREMLFLKKKLKITSAIDASDGLHASLRILSEESGKKFCVDVSRIMCRGTSGRRDNALRHALFDGEDFELVFTAKPERISQVVDEFEKRFRIPLVAIGTVDSGRGLFFRDADGRPVRVAGKEFCHFD